MTAARLSAPGEIYPPRVTSLHKSDLGETSQAEAQALRDYLADLPDPADFATALPPALIEALASAYRKPEGFRLSDASMAGHLRRLGLVEMGGLYLSNFGAAVRRAAMEG